MKKIIEEKKKNRNELYNKIVSNQDLNNNKEKEFNNENKQISHISNNKITPCSKKENNIIQKDSQILTSFESKKYNDFLVALLDYLLLLFVLYYLLFLFVPQNYL